METFTFTKAELEDLLDKARESSIGHTADGVSIYFDFTISEIITGIVCKCENRQDQHEKDGVWYCSDCGRRIKITEVYKLPAKNEKKTKKPLLLWNGRIMLHNTQYHAYVAAYSKKQAIEIMNSIDGVYNVSMHEINKYFSKGCWGKSMDGIVATEPCVYITMGNGKPQKMK